MAERHISFEQLSDIMAFRVIVKDVAECYRTLGLIHQKWPMVPGRFKDYISTPKRNGYRSLHTSVIHSEKARIEIQIRSHEMHAQAELGVAAHWKYKEGKGGGDAFDRKIAWMRRLLDGAGDGSVGEGSLAGELDAELVEDRIYALTPKGEVVDLPRGGTVLDFAYHVHTMVGHRTRGAKVNGRIMPLMTELKNGDEVEIIRSKAQVPPAAWEHVGRHGQGPLGDPPRHGFGAAKVPWAARCSRFRGPPRPRWRRGRSVPACGRGAFPSHRRRTRRASPRRRAAGRGRSRARGRF